MALAGIVLTTWQGTSQRDATHSAGDPFGTSPSPAKAAVASRRVETVRPSLAAKAPVAVPSAEFSTEELDAMKAYGSACEVGETTACVALGVMYANHRGGGERAHLPEAARLFKQACEEDNAIACNDLGILFLDPVGTLDDTVRLGTVAKKVPNQLDKAIALFDRACRAGSSDGCNNLGAMRERGVGLPQDLGEARRLYAKACDGGMVIACSNLAALYAKHDSLGAPPAETEGLFMKACEGGNSRACVSLAEYAYRMHAN